MRINTVQLGDERSLLSVFLSAFSVLASKDDITKLLSVIRLNLPLQFNRQRLPFAINGIASGDANPAFADAVFLDVFAFFVVKANADIVFEHFGRMERAFGISGKMIGQGWFFSGFGHGRILK
jgi:hypothetical protein